MNSRTLLAAVLVWILTVETSFPGVDNYLTEAKRNLVLQAEEHLFNDHFDHAQQTADSLIELYPDDPIGYVSKAAVYLGRMTDAEANMFPDSLRRLVDTAVVLAELGCDSTTGRRRAWMYLCLGHAQAYRSLWESRFGSFASALKQGFAARSSYEKGLASDSALYDLYGGLGMYHYWKSAKAGILRWLGIFKNDRERGIRELHLAADSSVISRRAAQGALVWIWLDRKEYDSVIVSCQGLLEHFGEGKMFLWPLAQAYFETERYSDALGIYRRLRARFARSAGNYYNLIECDYRLYQCYRQLDMDSESGEVAESLVDYYKSIPEKTRRRQRSKIAFLKREYRR